MEMKKSFKILAMTFAFVLGITSLTFADDDATKGYTPEMQAKCKEAKATLQSDITTFSTLDFVVFSHQQWTRLHESHSKDVVVNWPDGHKTHGIKKHIEDLKALFVYAPDTRIEEHPIKFGASDGDKEWTCVTGIMLGTFTKKMPIGGGKFIEPTGKKFAVPMCTVGHWKNGVMVEEWLYWDNQTYMKQIGLAQ
jgi:hypothetical protein